jgi:hypothetical protein
MSSIDIIDYSDSNVDFGGDWAKQPEPIVSFGDVVDKSITIINASRRKLKHIVNNNDY